MSGPPPPIRNKSLDAKRASKATRHRAQLDLLDNKNIYPPITSVVSLEVEFPRPPMSKFMSNHSKSLRCGGARVLPLLRRNYTTSLLQEEPDMCVGEQVKLKGNLNFESLLRIDGTVEGHLAVHSTYLSVDSSLKSMTAAVHMKRDAKGWVPVRSDVSTAGSRAGSRTPSLASLSIGRADAPSKQSGDAATRTTNDFSLDDVLMKGEAKDDDDTFNAENLAQRILQDTTLSYPVSRRAADIAGCDIDDDVDDVAADTTAFEVQNLAPSSIGELDGGSFITSLLGQGAMAVPTPEVPEISDNTMAHSSGSVCRPCVKVNTLDAPSLQSAPGSPLQAQGATFNTSSVITHSLPAPRSQTTSGVYRAGSRAESIRELYAKGGGKKVFVSMANRGLN